MNAIPSVLGTTPEFCMQPKVDYLLHMNSATPDTLGAVLESCHHVLAYSLEERVGPRIALLSTSVPLLPIGSFLHATDAAFSKRFEPVIDEYMAENVVSLDTWIAPYCAKLNKRQSAKEVCV